jgi:endonuclease/exonuclease/phosphatase family metal-dependent hydrolase
MIGRMLKVTLLTLCFYLLLIHSSHQAEFKVSAFNVEVFGKTKMSNRTIADLLVRVFRKYDIAIIQEIRDASGEAIQELLAMINDCAGCPKYNLELSEPLGRSNSKEQYGWFYRRDSIKILGTHQCDWSSQRGGKDVFERPPHSVHFQTRDGNRFVFSGIHVRPDDAVAEIDALTDLYPVLHNKFNEPKVIFMGDFNAGCRYLPRSRWPEVRLRTQANYQWYIGDDADTTVALSECPYDRFVGRHTEGYVTRPSVYRIDLDFNIHRDLARRVSDHWPIDFTLVTRTVAASESAYFMANNTNQAAYVK